MSLHDTLQLGPILGLPETPDPSRMRVWLRVKTRESVFVRCVRAPGTHTFNGKSFAVPPAPPVQWVREVEVTDADWKDGVDYVVGQVTLDGLEPDQRYFYEVVSAQERKDRPAAFVNDAPPSFRTLPRDGKDVSFAFMSCNDVDDTPIFRGPMDMWQRAVNVVVGREAGHFAILAGDQVYADSVHDKYRKLVRRQKLEVNEGLAARIAKDYGETYLDYWGQREIRTFMAHVPVMMMWDDHDIYDGYGSHGNEGGALQQMLFTEAHQAFALHQKPHNPVSATTGKHWGFAFRIGKFGFLVIDGRSCRRRLTADSSHTESPIIGKEQWSDLKRWLDDATDKLTHLTVVTGVPLVFLPNIAENSIALGRVSTALTFEDDLRDQWSSPGNFAEQRRLLGTLYEFRQKSGANVLLAGGDVHAGAVGRVESVDPRYLHQQEKRAVLHQLVASGIAHAAAPFFLYSRVSNETYNLGHQTEATFGVVYNRRNFAVVQLLGDADKRFTMHLYVEGDDRPKTSDRPFSWGTM